MFSCDHPHLLYAVRHGLSGWAVLGLEGEIVPFLMLSHSPVFNLSRACSVAPAQHALERGPMKEAIDFCRLQRGPFYPCPLGDWGRRAALGRTHGLRAFTGGRADQRQAALPNHGKEGRVGEFGGGN